MAGFATIDDYGREQILEDVIDFIISDSNYINMPLPIPEARFTAGKQSFDVYDAVVVLEPDIGGAGMAFAPFSTNHGNPDWLNSPRAVIGKGWVHTASTGYGASKSFGLEVYNTSGNRTFDSNYYSLDVVDFIQTDDIRTAINRSYPSVGKVAVMMVVDTFYWRSPDFYANTYSAVVKRPTANSISIQAGITATDALYGPQFQWKYNAAFIILDVTNLR